MEHPDGLESPLQILERRLVIAEEEKAQLQRKLHELEEEKERLALELQAQREGERNRLILAEEEKERISFKTCKSRKRTIRSFWLKRFWHQLPREGQMLPQLTSSGGGTSRRSGRWFWALGGLLLLSLLLAGTICLLAGLFFFGKPAWAFFGSSSAKVTMTQAAYGLTDNYIFTGVTHSISAGENAIDHSTCDKCSIDPWQECNGNIDVPQHAKSVYRHTCHSCWNCFY